MVGAPVPVLVLLSIRCLCLNSLLTPTIASRRALICICALVFDGSLSVSLLLLAVENHTVQKYCPV